jgi:GntR family transcriptional regulator / MocR family aminotransferase
VDWAADTGALIIEDDYDGEFRFDRQGVGAMQALAPEQDVYAGTASKSLAPGLRIGWLVPPAHLVDELVIAKARIDRLSSTLDQLTLAELISSGAYDRHVRRCRLDYRRRRERLVAALEREAPGVHTGGVAAGLHLLVDLPDRQTEEDLAAHAAERGLALDGLSLYTTEPSDRRGGLVIGYATPPEHALSGAVARLCAALAIVDR